MERQGPGGQPETRKKTPTMRLSRDVAVSLAPVAATSARLQIKLVMAPQNRIILAAESWGWL
jgi:hypothetical protein